MDIRGDGLFPISCSMNHGEFESMMTVGQLIKILEEYQEDERVLVLIESGDIVGNDPQVVRVSPKCVGICAE